MSFITRVTDSLTRQPPLVLVAFGVALTLVIGVLDYVTGAELTLFVFYLVPVALVTWFAGRRPGLVVMLFAYGTWLFASLELKQVPSNPLLAFWNLALPLVYLASTFLLVSRLRTSRRQLEENKEQLLHDALTGLPNGILFMDRLKYAVERAKRSGNHSYAVLYLDLDRFKMINDSLGHAFGDFVLMTAATRLQGCLRAVDTVARLGGDEFVVLLNNDQNTGDAVHAAQRIQRELNRPIRFSGHEVSMSASIGIAMARDEEDMSETLLRDADTALYRAKALGKARYEIFDASMHNRAMARLQLETEMRRAIERQEFKLYYQPIVDVASGQVISAEALIRWDHPDRGLIYPGDFIPIAEETGLIFPIGEWVLRTAAAQAQAWQAAGHPPLRVAVNVSARQFHDGKLSFLTRQALDDTALAGHLFEVEITESTAMQDVELTRRVLNDLNEMQIHLSIDDFGNGYSSLEYLRRFPVKTLKIGRLFIGDVVDDMDHGALTSAMIAFGHRLSLTVTAEGVETRDQLAFLKSRDCDLVQGFLFCRPVPPEVFGKLVRGGQSLATDPTIG